MDTSVKHVLFYKNEENEIISYAILDNGEAIGGNREDGEEWAFQLARNNDIKSCDELITKDYMNCFTDENDFRNAINEYSYRYLSDEEKLKRDINNFLNRSSSDENNEDNKKKFNFFKRKRKEKIKSKHKSIRKIIKRTVIVCITLLVANFGIKGIKKGIEKFQSNKNIENNIDDKNNKNGNKSKHKENIGDYNNLNSALEKSNINSAKKSAVKSTWKFLKNYNKDVAKQYKDKKKKQKLAHTWNEAMAYYLAFNDIPQSEVNKIFDNYKFNAEKMKNAYKEGIEQDIQAYSILNSFLGKEDLINSQKGKNFYTDYEKMMIKFNSIDNSSYITRESVANEFYKKVKKDLLGDKDLKSYKLSVIPIVKTFNHLTKDMNFSEKLTNNEIDKINKLSSSVYSKFKKYERNLETNRITDEALNNSTNEISYSSLKNLGVKELRVNGYYNVADSNRDITKSNAYKVSMANAKPTTISQSGNDNNITSSKATNESIANQDNHKEEVKDKENTDKKVKKVKKDNDGFIPVNYDYRPVDSTEEIDTDNIHYDDDTTINMADINNASNVNIEDGYIDNSGSIDSSVINITTDSTNAVSGETELPNPNGESQYNNPTSNYSSEVVADMIVESMANPGQTNSDGYTYKKI